MRPTTHQQCSRTSEKHVCRRNDPRFSVGKVVVFIRWRVTDREELANLVISREGKSNDIHLVNVIT